MKTKVNPTRQELLKLKKRLKVAKSGHKLLKEKLDGLMREFLKSISEVSSLQKKIERELPSALFDFFYSANVLGIEKTKEILSKIPKAEVEIKSLNIMGVKTASYNILNKEEVEGSLLDLRAVNTSLVLSRKKMNSLRNEILKYSSLLIKIKELALEIEKNRRRVNSLEHVYIPQMEKTGKYISQKLEEGERFSRTVILKIKTVAR